MPQLMLPRQWPGNFRRTVAGELLTFTPGRATEVSDAQYESLIENGDVGNALYPATVDEKGRARVDQETLDTLRGVTRPADDEPTDEAEAESGGDPSPSKPRRSRKR